MRRPLVRFEGVSKRFGGVTAVDRLTLDIAPNEFFALLGPSGCGKTTLLRMLAGFETPDEGRILLDGEDIAATPPHQRPVNMMFQSYALFPHLSVESNIAFGLRQEKQSKDEIATRVAAMLVLLHLEGLGRRKPDQLSGGQRQRVALARSLVKRPRVLLLDEPLAALDKKLRGQTQFELAELQRKLGTSFVIVTHDQDEAMIMASRIGVMNHGKLIQIGAPADVYERPESRWVAGFIGDVNLIEGGLEKSRKIIDTAHGQFRIDNAAGAMAGERVWLALRPERLSLATKRPSARNNSIVGTVHDVAFLGDTSIYHVRLASGSRLIVSASNGGQAARFSAGDKVWASWTPDAAVVLRR
ncbi:MAG: ABC transporter ATP-binding protein [Pseudolabrys sp.]|nr:ABC transporter ATP-binding protein [Pseudolabrys sp.]MBV9260866.1 ABC transporter ATP-binding protein [Pseudolabrys sp.]